MPCSIYGSATERVSRKRGWALELLEIEDGLVLHAYPVSYEFRCCVEIMLTFTLLRYLFYTTHLYPSTCSVIQHPLTDVKGLNIALQFLQVLAFFPQQARQISSHGDHDAPKFNHMYCAVATCSGSRELPEQMRDANQLHAPLPTPFPISTSFGFCSKNPQVDLRTHSNKF